MPKVKEKQILYDAKGKKTHVVLPIEKYEELLSRLEDHDDVLLMKEVEKEKSVSWNEAKKSCT